MAAPDKKKVYDVEGPISEHADFLHHLTHGLESIDLNLAKMTFINSIGVKNWLTWSMRIGPHCNVFIFNCPFVMLSQARMVQGFLPPTFYIQSFFAPYICDCGAEKSILFQRGVEYEYSIQGGPGMRADIPEKKTCEKCGQEMEADFVVKSFTNFMR